MDAATEIRPFAFDRIFTAASAKREAANALDLEMEVDSLRAEVERLNLERDDMLARARADGFEAGLAQARSERETALLSAVDALHAAVEQIEKNFTEVQTAVRNDAATVALEAADMLAGRALERAPEQAINEALGRVLEQVGRGPKLQIRVHPDLVERMEELVAFRISQERRRMTLTVFGDATLALGDALIGWDEGGLRLDAEARRAAVLEELAPFLG